MRKTNSGPILGAVAVAAAALTAPTHALACNGDGGQTIGSICITATNFCPRGYALAAGGLITITDNQALFALIGNTFGGDGRSTFGVPDFRGRSPVGVGSGPGLSPVFWGEERGDEVTVLSIAEMPAHTHDATAVFTPDSGGGSSIQVDVAIPVVGGSTAATTNTPDPTVNLAEPEVATTGFDVVSIENYSSNAATTTLKPFSASVTGSGGATGGTVSVSIEPTGGGPADPVITIPPQLAINFCIAVEGIFPQRN